MEIRRDEFRRVMYKRAGEGLKGEFQSAKPQGKILEGRGGHLDGETLPESGPLCVVFKGKGLKVTRFTVGGSDEPFY